jgi:heptosyltransferase I
MSRHQKKHMIDGDHVQKLLVVKTSSLGDIIHAFPALSYLHRKFPQAQIDWVVEKPFAPLVQAHPYVTRTLCIDTKNWRQNFFKMTLMREMLTFRKQLRDESYDVVFDLQGNTKSGLVVLQTKCRNKVGYDRKSVWEWPNLLTTNRRFDPPVFCNVREENLYLVKRFFGDDIELQDEKILLKISEAQLDAVLSLINHPHVQKGSKILVCPGSAWRNKQLTAESLADFLTKLHHFFPCSFLFAWGSSEELHITQRLQSQFPHCSLVIDKLPLPSLQHLMSRVDLVIAMDSLPLHLAGTTRVPTFSVFGPSSANKYKPVGKQHHAIQGQCPYGLSIERRCARLRKCPTGLCVRGLSGHELFTQFHSWWQRFSVDGG